MSSGISHNPPGSTVCSRCGGRVMNPPVSPETPFTSNGASNLNGPTSQPDSITIRSYQCRTKDPDRAPNPIKLGTNEAEPLPSRQRHWEENGSRSPDSKRRRFNPQGMFKPSIHREKSPDTSYPVSPYTPRPDTANTRGFQMLQPPRPYRHMKEYPTPDPSLKLPPLQTSASSAGSMTPVTPFPQENSTSLEATVMTIPFLNKIKVLAKISPPLVPSFRDGALQRRGPVIAVDGQDPASVKMMVDYLHNVLQKEGKYHTRVFGIPEIRQRESYSESGQMGDATVDYLNTISVWHRISDEIISFIKFSPESPESKSAEECENGVSPKGIVPKTADMQISSPAPPSDTGSASVSSSSGTASYSVPVAIVPRYQLTTADSFACSVPINDSYAPLDHWQWMASLWRACVGPDITVYIRECEKDEMERFAGSPVEVRLQDARTVVVRRGPGSPKELEEKSMKRVGFEIEDYLTQ